MTDRPAVTSALLRPTRPLTGYADVVDLIRKEISLGRILPGERLPAERVLAVELGVARDTLRQALRVLQGSGQIAITRGAAGGAVVQETTVPSAVAREELRQRSEQLLGLLEFRSELETVAARFAAERRQTHDLEEMHDAQQALLAAPGKEQSRRADTAFHLAVGRASANPYLAAAIEDARAVMFYPVDLVPFSFLKETSHAAHHDILQQIEQGDAEGAAAAMRRHIAASRAEVVSLMEGGWDDGLS
ncbi:FadR/GntR family transcriptional regulator [Aeromicrobium endophyticum]|uniref:FadR family transcriptional regulator n=1 Tax=Aeromicrobium endophyticum TaxID=2292704 RepID=A0A371NYX2_9ACTN|nr:FCD domain-containing protein [Aeromicrobium endophyticum]REK68885.1 FadR family transcriptional regulator [Aeromicrobium endophyticum]